MYTAAFAAGLCAATSSKLVSSTMTVPRQYCSSRSRATSDSNVGGGFTAGVPDAMAVYVCAESGKALHVSCPTFEKKASVKAFLSMAAAEVPGAPNSPPRTSFITYELAYIATVSNCTSQMRHVRPSRVMLKGLRSRK